MTYPDALRWLAKKYKIEIHKQGRIAKAIRAVVKAAASKEDKKVVVDIL